MTFGGDAATQGLKSDQLATGEERVHYEDLYTQVELRPVQKISLLPGVRLEHHETYGYHVNPSINAMWNACSYFNLRGTVSRGFRAPSIKELYFEFDHSAAGYKVIGGGDDLEPETSNNYSITAEINYNRRAMHRLSVFRNDLTNLIEFSDGDFSDPTYWRGIYYYDNIVKARTQGIEWETEIRALKNLDLSFSYTYLEAKNLTEEIDLINRPDHTFKFNTSYMISPIETRLNFWGYWQDHKLWTSEGDTPDRLSNEYAPSRWDLNLSLSKRVLDDLDLFFRVENLTNDINAKYGYWPERSYTVSLTYNFDRSR
jgi:outer membrane receptor for ferrienterochelin and colicins